MAVAPLSIPQLGAVSGGIDFSPLANLGQVYQKAQEEQARKQTLAQLGQGGTPDAMALLKSGDLSLAQMGIALRNREQDLARQGAQDARQSANDKFNQNLQTQQLGLSKRAADRADEDKFIVKEVTDPNTGATSLVRIKTTGNEGVINTGVAPTTGNPNLNPKAPFNQALLKEDAGRVAEYSNAGKMAEEGSATLDQIDNLRKQAFTAPVIGPLASKVGYPANQALDAAANQLSLDVAQKMKGSLSDKDIAFVKSQIPTAATGGSAGEAASGLIRSGFERTKQRAAFYRSWAELNGNINGADVAWNRYISENPLTIKDDKALGGRKFNPDYNKNFTPYIKGAQTGQGNGADSMLAFAREAIAQGAPRAEVIKRLQAAGIETSDF